MSILRLSMIILIFLLIDRNNLFMVHGISGKMWLSRRHNKLSRSYLVNINMPTNHKIETSTATEASVNFTCHNQRNQDELYPDISNAATLFYNHISMFGYLWVFGILSIIRTGYWTGLYIWCTKFKTNYYIWTLQICEY